VKSLKINISAEVFRKKAFQLNPIFYCTCNLVYRALLVPLVKLRYISKSGEYLKHLSRSEILRLMFRDISLCLYEFVFALSYQIGEEAGSTKVRIRGHDIVLPNNMQLVDIIPEISAIYAETFAPHNSHQYFHSDTKIREGDIVLDIGASEGLFSLECLRNNAGKIYIFEPSQVWFDILKLRFKEKIKVGKVEVMPIVVGDKNQYVRFGGSLMGSGLGGRQIVRKMRTVDSLVREKRIPSIDFVKMDVEGAEMRVLIGAKDAIRRFKPRMAITTYHRASHANDIIEYVLGLRKDYKFKLKGIQQGGYPERNLMRPTMVHFWS